MLRSAGVVVAGYLIFAMSAFLMFQLSGHDPHAPATAAFMIASIAWGALSALVAGWLTARMAARKHASHAAALAVVIAVGALVSLVAAPPGAIWSQVAALAVLAPCAWAGGLIALAQMDRALSGALGTGK